MLSRYRPSTKYGVSDKKDFVVYEKVFARMKSYPPWPAKIMPQKFEMKSKSILSNCIVYFYGTGQIGECSFVDIYDYENNKERFRDVCQSSRSMKKPFQEAFDEAEADDGNEDDFDVEYADEAIEFEMPIKILLEREQKKVSSRKRKGNESMDELDPTNEEQNRTLNTTGYSSQDDNEDEESVPEEETADDDDDDDFEMSRKTRSRSQSRAKRRKGGTRKSRAGSKKKTSSRRGTKQTPRSECDANGADRASQPGDQGSDNNLTGVMFVTRDPERVLKNYVLRDVDIYDSNYKALKRCEDTVASMQFMPNIITVCMPDGILIELPVRPKTATTSAAAGPHAAHSPAELSTIAARVEEYEKLKILLEKGKDVPPDYDTLVSAQRTAAHQEYLKAKRAKALPFLRVEAKLLAEEYKLKQCLSMAQVNFATALNVLDTVMNLDVRPLMLKKNPQVIKTFKDVQNYNVSNLKTLLAPEFRDRFESTAALIRNGADAVIEKWSTLFDYPDDMPFYRAFYLELVAFIEETRGVPRADVLMLTDETSVK